ncbi:MAG TPA: hypothetical protein VHC97_25475 [Thermoanaerobaculia bacterium]|jgi:hypothetical protein|nr:hypothetical protein [Thermoanaerobaculia bacterium]
MPKNSQDALFQEWEEMVQAAREDEAELTGLAPFRAALEHAHSQAVACRCLRDTLNISAEDATRRLQEHLTEGRDTASRLRSFVKSMFGRRSEKLRRYGIKTRSRRLRRPPRPPGGDVDLVS